MEIIPGDSEMTPDYWKGFDDAIEVMTRKLNDFDSKSLFTVHVFIAEFKEQMKVRVKSYKEYHDESSNK